MTMQFSANTVARNCDLQEIIAFRIGVVCGFRRMKFAPQNGKDRRFSTYFISEILTQASALFS